MGLYDTVLVMCPECGESSELQSKGGACKLETYGLYEAPDDVLLDINRHGPVNCSCGVKFTVEVTGERPRRTLAARTVLVGPAPKNAEIADTLADCLETCFALWVKASANRCFGATEAEQRAQIVKVLGPERTRRALNTAGVPGHSPTASGRHG
jgi:hypothetical protein